MSSAYWSVTEVKIIADYTLSVRFKDGLEGVVRFLPGFFRGVFSHLIDNTEFHRVSVVDGAVTWPNNLDLAPDAMHAEIQQRGEWIVDN